MAIEVAWIRRQVRQRALPLALQGRRYDYERPLPCLQRASQKPETDVSLSEPDGVGDDDTAVAIHDRAGALVCPALVRGQGTRETERILCLGVGRVGEVDGQSEPVELRRIDHRNWLEPARTARTARTLADGGGLGPRPLRAAGRAREGRGMAGPGQECFEVLAKAVKDDRTPM